MQVSRNLARFSVLILFCCASASFAQSQQTTTPQPHSDAPAAAVSVPDPQGTASVSGTVKDVTGTGVVSARVILTRGNQAAPQETSTDENGSFSFAALAPGPYTLTISATGFSAKAVSGTLFPAQNDIEPPVVLALATNVTEVQVTAPRAEVAEAEIKVEEKQRVLGVIPNFYVSYLPNAEPLDAKQKFELAWKSMIDPMTFLIVGAAAGIEQSEDAFNSYGQGAEGYAKRYGAAYADAAVGTFIGSALLPSLLKQDPRYFYKGTGSARSRLLYALANAVICKGDNKHWQPNYSAIAGSFAAGGIANLYYPAAERGAASTVENALIAIGESAAANVFQEFVIKKFTPGLSKHNGEKS